MEFPLQVPRPYLARIRHGDPQDPLLTQVLPVQQELDTVEGFDDDPLDEAAHNPHPGIVHKYRNRLLLIVSPACAINCRYCFRRHFPYQQQRQNRQQWQSALDYIRQHRELNEIIYSGGDPLAANDKFLGWLTEQISQISHIKRLRVHSRLPIVIPSRIDDELLQWMTASRLQPTLVVHINHPNEIDDAVEAGLHRLQENRIRVFNQSVLLKGVNDCAETLAALSERLYDCRVNPYYLHLLDPVKGAAHFDVCESRATHIYAEMQATLPGFLLPRLVREVPGKAAKTIVATTL
jgi:EF-P beta-lysylation protein EpmB